MNSTRLGVRPLGRATLAYALVLVMALSIVAPGTAIASQGGPYGPAAHQGGYGDSTYYVKPGDTLSMIALRFGVTTDQLMRVNGLRNPNHIYVGQALTIPDGGGGGTGGPQCGSMTHVVRYGETASQIAQRYGIDLYDLARANDMLNLNRVYAGQTLCIPGGGMPVQPVQPQPWQPVQPVQPKPVQPQPQPVQPVQPKPVQPQPQPVQPVQPKPVQPQPQPVQPGPQQPGMPPQCGDQPGSGGFWPPDCADQPRPGGPSHETDLGYWRGSYFKDKYFSEFVEERQDSEIRFNWYKESPGANMPKDRFSIRWERVLNFDGGDYRFHATADDGVRVYVDDTLVIDGWKIQPATEYHGDISLRPGKHKVVVEYYEEAEDALITVYWEPKCPSYRCN